MNIEKTVSFLSVSYSFLLVYGLVYNVLLYHEFNLQITEYIDLSEILMLFTNAHPAVFLFPFMGFLGMEVLSPAGLSKDVNNTFYGILFDGWLLKPVVAWTSFFLPAIIFFILFSALPDRHVIYAYSLLFFWAVLFLPLGLRIIYESLYKGAYNGTFVFLILYVCIFLMICVSITVYYKKRSLLHKFSNPRFTILLTDGNIIQNSEHIYYLGKTKDYLFIYNEDSLQTRVIPVNAIKEHFFGASLWKRGENGSFPKNKVAPIQKQSLSSPDSNTMKGLNPAYLTVNDTDSLNPKK